MQTSGVGRGVLLIALTLLISVSAFSVVSAVPINSPSYEVSEPEFGAGAALDTCSGKYCAHASIGNPAAGEMSSASYEASFSEVESDDEPVLEVIIEPGESDLGILSTTETATKTTIVKVKNYLTDGYMVQVVGKAPEYEGYRLKTYNTPTQAEPGKEFFGVNLVANSSPKIGKNMEHLNPELPGTGFVMDDYLQVDHFMYRDGDVVAMSETDSSEMTYTISMVVNISNSTPAGHYIGDFAAIVIPIF